MMRMPRRNSLLSSGITGVSVVARGAFGTSFRSLMVSRRSCSMVAPALTTLKKSAESGVSRALAISRPSRG